MTSIEEKHRDEVRAERKMLRSVRSSLARHSWYFVCSSQRPYRTPTGDYRGPLAAPSSR